MVAVTIWDFADRNATLLVLAFVFTSPVWGSVLITLAAALGTWRKGRSE